MTSQLEALSLSLIDKAVLDSVSTGTHHFQDDHDGLLQEPFFCRPEFALKACAHGSGLAPLPPFLCLEQVTLETRKMLEDLNVQLLCGIPALWLPATSSWCALGAFIVQ